MMRVISGLLRDRRALKIASCGKTTSARVSKRRRRNKLTNAKSGRVA